MRYFLLPVTICSLLLISFSGRSQQQQIEILVQDVQKNPLEYVALSLYKDSTQKLMNLTDSNGMADFSIDSPGAYTLKADLMGYSKLDSQLLITTDRTAFIITLQQQGNALKEVVVSGERPLMRQEDDKMIVDATQLAEASSNGYEIIEKTPGLFVDQDGNIYLSSTTPATVYINGRELRMSRSDVASMLKNLPPNSIEKIEILRTPSAKYDASGSGGIVNVVLKKGVKIGLNGSINSGFMQGVYGNQYAGFNIANNDGSTNTYLNLNYSHQNNYQQLNTDRILFGDTALSQKAYTTYPGHTLFSSFGISKDIDSQWNIGYDGRISYNPSENHTGNTNQFINIHTGEVLGSTYSNVDNYNKGGLADNTFSSKYKIDTSGSEWSMQLQYTYSKNESEQAYEAGSILGIQPGNGQTDNNRHFGMFQSDINKKLPHDIHVEAGIKSSYLLFNNDSKYFTGYTQQTDYNRTTLYRYTENINAAYIQGSKKMGGFLLKAGVRMENTNMQGQQKIPGDTTFKIQRTDLFPYVYFSKKIMAIAGYDLRAYLVYRKTISRPSYEQLNPFPKYVDQFMSEIGNPNLKPQFTHNYEANISVDERPLFAVGYNNTRDLFSNVFYQSDSNISQAYRSYDNIGENKEFYLRGLAAIPPGGRYFAVVGAQYNHNQYTGLYEGKPINFTGESWLMFTYHQLKIDKKSTLTLNGFWRFAGALQFYQLSEMGSLSVSINRRMLKDKLMISLNASDIFYTNNNRFTVRQGSVDANGSRAGDTRRYGINLRYNFGIRKKEDNPGMFDVNTEGRK